MTGSSFLLQIPGWDSSFSCKTSPLNPLKVVFSVIRSKILLKPMVCTSIGCYKGCIYGFK